MIKQQDARKGEGEKKASAFRSSRYFQLHNYWYVATREGAALGPFDTREQAAQTIEDYIGFIRYAPVSAMELLHREQHFGLH